MKFKSVANPPIAPSVLIVGKKEVVPNQSMSLAEILQRFTRGEKLPVSKGEGVYYEDGEDLEKAAQGDLTEKMEFVERQKATQERFSKQEKKKREAAQKAAHEEAVRLEQAKITAAKALSGSGSEQVAK